MKKIPKFKTKVEKQRFWIEHDSADYVDWSKAKRASMMKDNISKAKFVVSAVLLMFVLLAGGCKSGGISASDGAEAYRVIGDEIEHLKELGEFRSALNSFKKRYEYGGSCKEAWDQLVALVAEERLKRVIIPEFTIGPPATIIDAVDFFKQASRDYDDPTIPVERRGVSLILKMNAHEKGEGELPDDPFAEPSDAGHTPEIPVLPRISARFISLYDALTLVCDAAGYQFRLSRGLIMITPAEDVLAPLGRDVDEAYRVIGEDLDSLYTHLKTLERMYGKPLEQSIYDALNHAKQAADNQDYVSLRELNGELHHRIKEHLVAESALEEYRLALEKIGRRLENDSPCKEVWNELRELRTKEILQEIVIQEIVFRPPDTLTDAIDFFKQASREYYKSKGQGEQHGVSLCLKLRGDNSGVQDSAKDDPSPDEPFENNDDPVIPALSARYITLYDALKLVCDVTGYKLRICGDSAMIIPHGPYDAPVNELEP
ncbi:MAG: CopG family antitoxin [Kiritimatiellae bacterium]|nr:CopG family antitoxin [Kiritimatiellia bacterium]